MRNFLYIFFCFLTVFSVSEVNATHIRAGEITAQRVNNNTYTITLTIYGNKNSPIRDDNATLVFGDGTTASVFYNFSEVTLSSDTYRRTYVYNKTFSGTGTFRISYREFNRNGGIVNMFNSINTPFYIETYISISPFTGANNPVQLTIPPIDKGSVGKLFTHNPGAYDIDGDSLSFKLVVPKQGLNIDVTGYQTPAFSTSFTLDPVTGDLVWKNPTKAGLYNIAFIIEEWRKGADGTYSRVSYVTRDMQIEIKNSVNNPPVLTIPDDTCILAGTQLIKTITADDPDGDFINMSAFLPTHFTVSNPQAPIAAGVYNWTTQCIDVREQPYEITFRAEDVVSQDTLVDYKTWLIKVKGPAPTGLSTTPVGNSIVLSWNAYPCANAESIEIFRKECDSSGYIQQPCESGREGRTGYVKIGEVPIGTSTFIDNNNGKGLLRGSFYCYFLVAQFPLPKGGESYASSESCQSTLLDVAVVTSVSVTATSTTLGEITLAWLDPVSSPLPAPYLYNVYRASGMQGTVYSLVASNVTSGYIDSGLNTADSSYRYKIELVGGGFSDPASSLYLKLSAGNNQMSLSWASNSPWNDDSLDIFRSVNGAPYTQLTRIIGNPGKYLDNVGLSNCDTVSYFIRMYSSYCNPNLPQVTIINLSEIKFGSPTDGKLPKKPVLVVKGCEGDLTNFTNVLDWNDVDDPVCSVIKKYKVYYSDYEDTDLGIIATTPKTVTDYIYTNPITTAGCFAVSAVNKAGVEGPKSEKVCVDDCVYYELPNLVTPNGDSLNDLVVPFPVPRGVEQVRFSVYNRWGGLVFSSDSSIQIKWNSVSIDGQRVSDGVYYYSAEVKYFRRKNRKDEHQTLKSWLQVLSNNGTRVIE